MNLKEKLIEKVLSELFQDKPSATSDDSIYSSLIGKKVIVRTYAAGVFYCIIKQMEGDVALTDECRRIWYWDGATELSDLSLNGIKNLEGSKISPATTNHLIFQIVEIFECSSICTKQLDKAKDWTKHD